MIQLSISVLSIAKVRTSTGSPSARRSACTRLGIRATSRAATTPKATRPRPISLEAGIDELSPREAERVDEDRRQRERESRQLGGEPRGEGVPRVQHRSEVIDGGHRHERANRGKGSG